MPVTGTPLFTLGSHLPIHAPFHFVRQQDALAAHDSTALHSCMMFKQLRAGEQHHLSLQDGHAATCAAPHLHYDVIRKAPCERHRTRVNEAAS